MKTCYYCGACVAERHGNGDHFPVPARCGGIETVDCCTSCHDMKDRFPVDRWPAEWMAKVIEDFPKLSRETKIFLAKVVVMHADTIEGRKKTQAAAAETTGPSGPVRFSTASGEAVGGAA